MGDRNVYALFIDIMGFAQSIESLDEQQEESLADGIRRRIVPDGRGAARVYRWYSRFHKELRRFVGDWGGADSSEVVITFSDSALFVSSSVAAVTRVALQMMDMAFEEAIPLRMGLGRGQFYRLAFSTTTHPSGSLVADSPFLGSAVVRAHQAEASRPPLGLRIIVHPSAAQARHEGSKFADLPEGECTPHAAQELKFVDEYRTRSPATELPNPVNWYRDLAEMRKDVTSERALAHYDATERALDRLLGARQSQFLKDLMREFPRPHISNA